MKKTFSHSRLVLLLATGIVVLCLGGGVIIFQKSSASGANSRLTDDDIAQDLSILEKAVWKYDKLLPQSLNDVEARGLKGNVKEYQYHIIQQYEGGPGESFALCATFHSRSAKLDDSPYHYTYSNPEAYTYHVQGKQCFNIGWNIHGGESSIGLMKNVPEWARD